MPPLASRVIASVTGYASKVVLSRGTVSTLQHSSGSGSSLLLACGDEASRCPQVWLAACDDSREVGVLQFQRHALNSHPDMVLDVCGWQTASAYVCAVSETRLSLYREVRR